MADVANTQNTSNNSIQNSINQADSTKTARGTPIVKPGQGMDKNAFLRILSAELSNQDPENAKDGTEYVSQMAQFSGLEQMANLNSTMRMTGANSLIGRHITLNKLDEHGNLYNGEVQDVVKSGDNITLDVIVGSEKDSNGNLVNKVQEFNLEDLNKIDDSSSIYNFINNSSNLLNASTLIGKTVELNQQDSNKNNYTGVVKEVSSDTEGIKLQVQVGENDTKEFSLYDIIKIKES